MLFPKANMTSQLKTTDAALTLTMLTVLSSCSVGGPTTYPAVFPRGSTTYAEPTCHAQCFQSFEATGNAAQDVATLAQRCGHDCGLTPLGEVVTAAPLEGQATRTFPITLSNTHCYRVVAVGGAGVQDLDAALLDPQGHVLTQDTAQDNFPLLATREPYCPPYSGQYELVMAVSGPGGEYAYQVLQDGTPEPAPTGATEHPQRACAATCYAGFVPTQDATRDVQELGNRCGAGCGMTALAQPQLGHQTAAAEAETYAVELQKGQCYRLLAASGPGLTDLDAGILDPSGNVVLKDEANDTWPVLGIFEPYCPNVTGTHQVIMAVASGEGTYAFQLWHAARQ